MTSPTATPFRDAGELREWLVQQRGVLPETAAGVAPILFSKGHNHPDTLLNEHLKYFRKLGIKHPDARLLTNRLNNSLYLNSNYSEQRFENGSAIAADKPAARKISREDTEDSLESNKRQKTAPESSSPPTTATAGGKNSERWLHSVIRKSIFRETRNNSDRGRVGTNTPAISSDNDSSKDRSRKTTTTTHSRKDNSTSPPKITKDPPPSDDSSTENNIDASLDDSDVERDARTIFDEDEKAAILRKAKGFLDIGWHCPKRRPLNFSPAAILQTEKEGPSSTFRIKYIGVECTHETIEIPRSEWIPYSNYSDSDNQKHLQQYISILKGSDMVTQKIEESVIRTIWDYFKARQASVLDQPPVEEESTQQDLAKTKPAPTSTDVTVTASGKKDDSGSGTSDGSLYMTPDEDDISDSDDDANVQICNSPDRGHTAGENNANHHGVPVCTPEDDNLVADLYEESSDDTVADLIQPQRPSKQSKQVIELLDDSDDDGIEGPRKIPDDTKNDTRINDVKRNVKLDDSSEFWVENQHDMPNGTATDTRMSDTQERTKKRRGRPRKDTTTNDTSKTAKRRGRSRNNDTTAQTANEDTKPQSTPKKSTVATGTREKAEHRNSRKIDMNTKEGERRRPVGTAAASSPLVSTTLFDSDDEEDELWLARMKNRSEKMNSRPCPSRRDGDILPRV